MKLQLELPFLFFLMGARSQNVTTVFMAYLCEFYGERNLHKGLSCLDQFFTNLWSQKFWIWRKWRHTSEGRKHFTPGFLCIFLLILWKKNLMMFWPVFWCFELFSRTSEVTQSFGLLNCILTQVTLFTEMNMLHAYFGVLLNFGTIG